MINILQDQNANLRSELASEQLEKENYQKMFDILKSVQEDDNQSSSESENENAEPINPLNTSSNRTSESSSDTSSDAPQPDIVVGRDGASTSTATADHIKQAQQEFEKNLIKNYVQFTKEQEEAKQLRNKEIEREQIQRAISESIQMKKKNRKTQRLSEGDLPPLKKTSADSVIKAQQDFENMLSKKYIEFQNEQQEKAKQAEHEQIQKAISEFIDTKNHRNGVENIPNDSDMDFSDSDLDVEDVANIQLPDDSDLDLEDVANIPSPPNDSDMDFSDSDLDVEDNAQLDVQDVANIPLPDDPEVGVQDVANIPLPDESDMELDHHELGVQDVANIPLPELDVPERPLRRSPRKNKGQFKSKKYMDEFAPTLKIRKR